MHRGATVVLAVTADPGWGAFSCPALGLAFTYISSFNYHKQCLFTRAIMSKNNRLGKYLTAGIFLLVLEARSLRSRCQQGCCLLRPVSLPCSWPSFPCLTWSSMYLSILILFSYKDSSHVGLESTLMTSFELSCLNNLSLNAVTL